jgi:hypothetical protein
VFIDVVVIVPSCVAPLTVNTNDVTVPAFTRTETAHLDPGLLLSKSSERLEVALGSVTVCDDDGKALK